MRMTKTLYFSLLPLLLLGAVRMAAQPGKTPGIPVPTGGIQGTLVDETGAPIAGAFVIANRVGPSSFGKSTLSGPDGSYNVPNLPDGSYSLCVKVPGAVARLDPCEWSAAPTTVALADGKISTGNRLTAKKALTLLVRIEDPNHNLSPQSTTNGPPRIDMALTPAGTTSPAILMSTDRTGRTYQITAGYDVPLSFTIAAKHLEIVDESGLATPNSGALRAFSKNIGASAQPSFTYNVVGRTD